MSGDPAAQNVEQKLAVFADFPFTEIPERLGTVLYEDDLLWQAISEALESAWWIATDQRLAEFIFQELVT